MKFFIAVIGYIATHKIRSYDIIISNLDYCSSNIVLDCY